MERQIIIKDESFATNHISFLRVTHSINTTMNMRFFVYIILLICVAKAIAVKKCGIVADKCQLLINGDVFWPPDYNKTCSAVSICVKGHALYQETIGDLRACCCKVRYINECPACNMTDANQQTFSEWIDQHLAMNGPSDGLCSDTTLKRIFLGGSNKLDKCCCEPKDSPFKNQFSTE